MDKCEVAIVGAGLTGITAARRLKMQGRDNILLLDKGKSTGGRLATRRIGNGKADHGAQFFTVRTKELEDETQDWLKQGWIKRWYGEKYPRYTAVDGMNGLAKQLAGDLPTMLGSKVIKINKGQNGYQLLDEKGDKFYAEKILLTMPAPQIVQLLKASNFTIEYSLLRQLQKITFQPTYVGVFQLNEETVLPSDGQVDSDLPEGVERIVDHKKKGISEETIVSVYMTADWSRKYYGEDYVLGLIKERLESLVDWSGLESEQLKRWRYAQAKQTIQQPYLDLTGEGTLVAAGDAFLRPEDEAGRTRFESAYLSGKDAAAYISW